MAAIVASPGAEAIEFNQLQPGKSTVTFVYRQMNVPIAGSFRRLRGQISFDPDHPEAAKTAIEIELAGIDTGFAEGDEEVQGKLWFDSQSYPLARFVSTAIKPLDGNRFEVEGRLTLKGRTRELLVPAVFGRSGNVGVFEGSFAIRRTDYGIGEGIWADFGTVANEVHIRFRMTATAVGK